MQTPELLSDPVFHDEEAARLYLQEVRWPDGVYCPFCGTLDGIRPLGGDSMGPGWFYCEACKDKFTVRVGSIFERSHIPLHKWLLAFRLMASSKKGVSAHQLHRTLGITYKSAWFLAHRIREAMVPTDPPTLGGEGKTIEMDETFIGREGSHEPDAWVFVNGAGWVRRTGNAKMRVLTLVERGGGSRSIHVDRLNAANVFDFLHLNADRQSDLNTDEAPTFGPPGRGFKTHRTVKHADEEYVRRERDGSKTTTNTVEGFFGIFKRGMKGTHQHCGEKHLQRYLTEFDFRYSNRIALGIDDAQRTEIAIKGAAGKRLTYRRTRSEA
jgi:transposase-like protein